MPIFDYRCRDCQHVTTTWFASHKDVLPTIECAWCKGTMDKQIAAPNFSIQGFNAANGYSK